jgi:potassium-transporting ATPase potassium-binding subunit
MGPSGAGALFALSLAVAIALAYRPFGDYLYRSLHPKGHSRFERGVYRLVGVNPEGEQPWGVYARSVLAFSAVSILFLYLFQRVQDKLWLSLGFPPVKSDQAWNTAISFVTNTNWQSYAGESTMGHLVQMAGLAVQNFASAAVGIAVAVALVRGFARTRTPQLGNFWVDLVRICVRIQLPVAVLGAVVFIAAGVVQNLSAGIDVSTVAGGTQHITGGPVASQEIIKEFGTNGGGFTNANSAHPFENPTAWTNWLQVFLLLLIPFSLPRVFGRMVRDNRQGLAIAGIMAILATAGVVALNALQAAAGGTVPTARSAADRRRPAAPRAHRARGRRRHRLHRGPGDPRQGRRRPNPGRDQRGCSREHHQVVRPPTTPRCMGAPQRGQEPPGTRAGTTPRVCTPPATTADPTAASWAR